MEKNKSFIDSLTDDEREVYDCYTKDEIYEAYVKLYTRFNYAEKEIDRMGLVIAGLEYDLRKEEENGKS